MWGFSVFFGFFFFTDGQENWPLQTNQHIETTFSMKINASLSLIGNDPAAFSKQLSSYGYPEVRTAQFYSTVNYQDFTSCMQFHCTLP